MIVCHCNLLTSAQLDAAVADWRAQNPGVVATPGSIFASLDAVVACGGCMPLVVEVMEHHQKTSPFAQGTEPPRLRPPGVPKTASG
jgi:bacterioferritin-associated ferredoxin